MKITTTTDATRIAKPEGTTVWYYLFHDYEVMYNEQVAGTTQVWHNHDKIWETTYLLEGELEVLWREDGQEKSQILRKGDLAESERSPHTLRNNSGEMVKFLTIKRIPSDEDFSETFKKDKVLD